MLLSRGGSVFITYLDDLVCYFQGVGPSSSHIWMILCATFNNVVVFVTYLNDLVCYFQGVGPSSSHIWMILCATFKGWVRLRHIFG